MPSITTFTIDVPEARLQRLKQKLELTDFPDEVTDLTPDDAWSRGVPLSEMKRLVRYWHAEFNWRAVETSLNKLPQFSTEAGIEGFGNYQIHFIHQRSHVTNAIPLLFLHGWPGSFIEVTKILPLLVQGSDSFPAFHVVAPSLMDFGFSSGSKKKSFYMEQHAELCHKLMLSLGYDEYVIQAGDLGCLVARLLASKYGRAHCKALHTNSAFPAEPTASFHPKLYEKVKATPLSDDEIAGLGRTAKFGTDGNGYYKQLSTRDQTIAYSLADSPVGLLAWLYEKLHDWSDNYPWTDDEILTWVSIYYFSSAGAGASGRAYYALEHSDPPAFAASQRYVDVPLGIARFAGDTVLLPKLWSQTLGPVVYESEYSKGGHFAAWERPEDIVKDLRAMFGKGGVAGGCVTGKSGFDD
ncbi:unnamed protein product [Clonostachys byssicola]|uniref:Epoxide hydrolase N-terminal domain-containing protein n=1 Tax=Clonostachys byssicola TaxID=160290 RepID=A0A9N9UKT6_9HYPO|nr:unnamed protein product [Clonostachys byssicola]